MAEVRDLIVGNAEGYDFESCQTRIDPIGPYNKTDVIYALHVANGNLSKAAGLLDRSRRSLKDYVESQSDVLEYMDDLLQAKIDEIQDKYFEAAMNGEGSNARHILETLGKDRGFTKRTELTGKDGGPIDVNDPISKMLEAVSKSGNRLVKRIGDDG